MTLRIPIDAGDLGAPGTASPAMVPPREPRSPGSEIGNRISRRGLGVLIFGVLLMAGGSLYGAIEFYRLVNDEFAGGPSFQQYVLSLAVQDLALGIGLVVATIGWILDRRGMDAARGASSSQGFRTYATPGFILVGIGVFMIALDPLIDGIAEWADYQSSPIGWLTANVEVGVEIAASVGIVVLLIGWSLHHVAVLRWTEDSPA